MGILWNDEIRQLAYKVLFWKLEPDTPFSKKNTMLSSTRPSELNAQMPTEGCPYFGITG